MPLNIFLPSSCYISIYFHRVSMLVENTPGVSWSRRKQNVFVFIGFAMLATQIVMHLQVSQFFQPFYRACIFPAHKSFIFTIFTRTLRPKDNFKNVNLFIMVLYTVISTTCTLIMTCLVKKRTVQIQQVQNEAQLRVSPMCYFSTH